MCSRRAKLLFRDEGTSSQRAIPTKSCAQGQPQLSQLQRPTSRIPPRRPRPPLRTPQSGVVIIADPEHLPLDIYEPARAPPKVPSHITKTKAVTMSTSVGVNVRFPIPSGTHTHIHTQVFSHLTYHGDLSETMSCETRHRRDDSIKKANLSSTGAPMVRTRLRSLLRRLPPTLVIRRRPSKGGTKGLATQGIAH